MRTNVASNEQTDVEDPLEDPSIIESSLLMDTMAEEELLNNVVSENICSKYCLFCGTKYQSSRARIKHEQKCLEKD